MSRAQAIYKDAPSRLFKQEPLPQPARLIADIALRPGKRPESVVMECALLIRHPVAVCYSQLLIQTGRSNRPFRGRMQIIHSKSAW